MTDPFDLQRFLDAQSSAWPQARAELAAGAKRSHWMWFIFPQIRGLGSSPTAQRYAITSLDEARALLAHPVLGPRLGEATRLVLNSGRSVGQIFPYPDDLKFHSSMTLFAEAAGGETPFSEALSRLLGGKRDTATLDLLKL